MRFNALWYGLWCVILSVLSVNASISIQAEEQRPLRDVISKAIDAHGGEARLTKYPAQTAKVTITDSTHSYTGTFALHVPRRVNMEIDSESGDGNSNTIVDGDKGWSTFVIFGKTYRREMPAAELNEKKEALHVAWVETLVPLKERAFTVTARADTTVDDKPCAGVRVSCNGHRDVSLFFDKGSGLLLKTESSRRNWDQENRKLGDEVVVEHTFSEYVSVQGIMVAKRVKEKSDGKPSGEFTYSDVNRRKKLDDVQFERHGAIAWWVD